jgi:hypothetical protein
MKVQIDQEKKYEGIQRGKEFRRIKEGLFIEPFYE